MQRANVSLLRLPLILLLQVAWCGPAGCHSLVWDDISACFSQLALSGNNNSKYPAQLCPIAFKRKQ
jgi:hypothetical protein